MILKEIVVLFWRTQSKSKIDFLDSEHVKKHNKWNWWNKIVFKMNSRKSLCQWRDLSAPN